jgi:hypothetical protein
MTLSNFAWTDKSSLKWFILLPTGHEGPYSLESLIRKKISPDSKIWAEGLTEPVRLRIAIQRSNPILEITEDEIPPLPPLPEESEKEVESHPTFSKDIPPASSKLKKNVVFVAISLIVLIIALREWVSLNEEFSFKRPGRMNPKTYEKVLGDFSFKGWNERPFFKEYVPADLSQIWLVTSSFQHCHIEASFQSVDEKLLSLKNEKIIFKSTSELQNHVIEFSKFDFQSGAKIIPGLYEMDLKASKCKWTSHVSKLGNLFKRPMTSYMTRIKIVLYHQGSVEFNRVLTKLIQRKIQQELKNQNQEELFWQDLQQKLQTLLAISLQIEQLMIDFLQSPNSNFKSRLKLMVDKYTKNQGRFLTDFVIANEKYFVELQLSGLEKMEQKRIYEGVVKSISKSIGLETMKILEELQGSKDPKRKYLNETILKIKKNFSIIKNGINKKIIQMTEDRVK